MRMIRNKAILTAVLLAMAMSLSACSSENERENNKGVLRLYAGAGLRYAVEELAAAYERETGVKVEPDYGGSGMILARAQEDTEADLFMPGDVWYVDELARRKPGMIESKTQIAYFVPVIIVLKGNPKNIRSAKDFLRKDVVVALGNPKGPRVGQISGDILKLNGVNVADIDAQESGTVNELGLWVRDKAVDTAIVWRAIAVNVADSVDMIEIPKERNITSSVVIGLMSTSKNKPAAQGFIDFIAGEKGQAILKQKGYQIEVP